MVVGGENATLAEDILPGRDGILYNPSPGATAVSTYVFPEATIEAWRSFIITETARPSVTVQTRNNAAVDIRVWLGATGLALVVGLISGCILVVY
jgi:carboxypeptidase D